MNLHNLQMQFKNKIYPEKIWQRNIFVAIDAYADTSSRFFHIIPQKMSVVEFQAFDFPLPRYEISILSSFPCFFLVTTKLKFKIKAQNFTFTFIASHSLSHSSPLIPRPSFSSSTSSSSSLVAHTNSCQRSRSRACADLLELLLSR